MPGIHLPSPQRRTLNELRNDGVIGDEAMHHIERDLEESRREM